jgi:ACS family sodium-dependent inorganic phosphate cotransporter/ACS family sodium-dependent inorganic phosphate cotransporter-like MFS transporter 9
MPVCLTVCLAAGNLVGLVLSPLILMQFGWKALFYTFGLLGLPLLAVWLAATPAPNKAAAAAAAAEASTADALQQQQQQGKGSADDASSSSSKGEGVSVWKLLSHKATWAIIIVNIVNHWGYFIYLNWMPSYFSKVSCCCMLL